MNSTAWVIEYLYTQVRLELTGADLAVVKETRPDHPRPTQARARSTSAGGQRRLARSDQFQGSILISSPQT